MEAFGMVDRKIVYAGMDRYCAVLADELSPVDEPLDPHTFPDSFFDKIMRMASGSHAG